MRKIYLFITLLFLTIPLFSQSPGFYSLYNTSAGDITLGLDSGGTNVWNDSPVSYLSNPAKLGYQNGFGWSYFHDKFNDTDYYIQSSHIAIGYKGLGLLLPGPSAHSKWGSVERNILDVTNEEGSSFGDQEFINSRADFAIGLNMLQFTENLTTLPLNTLKYYFDLSIGSSFQSFSQKYFFEENNDLKSDESTALSLNLGFLGRFSPINNHSKYGEFFNLDLLYSFYNINSAKEKIEVNNNKYKAVLPYGQTSEFGVRIALKPDIINSLKETDLLDYFTDHLLAVYFVTNKGEYYKDDSTIERTGNGIEISALNLFYFRTGQQETESEYDESGFDGDTKGYGFKLDYKNTVQIKFDHGEYPKQLGDKIEERDEFSINFDLINLYQLF